MIQVSEDTKERLISFMSKKFLVFFIVLVLSSVFCWFGKMNEKYTMIIWISSSIFYGFWNVIQKLIDQLTIKDIKDIAGIKKGDNDGEIS